MKVLQVTINNREASYVKRCGEIICGNSDYTIQFTFDEEWDAYDTKTARFIWNGQYKDVQFTGSTCSVPILKNTDSVTVGVYAGQLQTTTAAVIGCRKSILCGEVQATVESYDGSYDSSFVSFLVSRGYVFIAPASMTWREWIVSEYAPANCFFLEGDNVVFWGRHATIVPYDPDDANAPTEAAILCRVSLLDGSDKLADEAIVNSGKYVVTQID